MQDVYKSVLGINACRKKMWKEGEAGPTRTLANPMSSCGTICTLKTVPGWSKMARPSSVIGYGHHPHTRPSWHYVRCPSGRISEIADSCRLSSYSTFTTGATVFHWKGINLSINHVPNQTLGIQPTPYSQTWMISPVIRLSEIHSAVLKQGT